MWHMVALASVLAAACASGRAPVAPHPSGYAEKMASADEHAQRAADERRVASLPDHDPGGPGGYQCGDVALSDQATSGGERLVQSVPCWDPGEESAEHHRFVALREQQLAATERRAAAGMVEDEIAACRGLSPRELEHSPFAHRREIAAVIPHRPAGVLRGVRIVWHPVLGLSADWMRRSIACHRARFERMGEPAIYLPDDPTLVARATVTVTQHSGHLEVLIETADDMTGEVVLARARDLLRPRTAQR
jgi:hypothetical protein